MGKLKGHLIVSLCFIFFVSCSIQSFQKKASSKGTKKLVQGSLPNQNTGKERDLGELKELATLTRTQAFEKMIFDHSPENATPNKPTKKIIIKWINYFTENDPKRFQRHLDRGQIYKDVIQTLLTDNDLHPDLFYLGLIESGYSNTANSTASAVGAWQFLRGTAKEYDLQVNYYIDERKDPIRSTDAASKYLNDLYNIFYSWELAMAAYNCGQYRVLRAIVRGKTRNFWKLSEKKLLPKETRNYVPKLIAAVIVGRNPENYGLKISVVENEYPNIEAVEVPSPIKLKDVSKEVNIPYKLLAKVNPHLTRRVTPPHLSLYEIWVPEGKGTSVKKSHAKLFKLKLKEKFNWVNTNANHYKVRKGDNLHLLANRFKVTVNFLKKINGLRSSTIYPRQKLRISSKSYHKKNTKQKSRYIYIRKGDSLSSISIRYKVPISKLKKINNLRNARIYIGQRLKI